MPDERDFDAKSELRDVLAALLALVLPAEQHELIPRLTDMVSACKAWSSIGASFGASYPRARGASSQPASASSLTR